MSTKRQQRKGKFTSCAICNARLTKAEREEAKKVKMSIARGKVGAFDLRTERPRGVKLRCFKCVSNVKGVDSKYENRISRTMGESRCLN